MEMRDMKYHKENYFSVILHFQGGEISPFRTVERHEMEM